MPTNAALVDFSSPDQSRQVIAAWDRLLRDNDLPANLVRNVIEHSLEALLRKLERRILCKHFNLTTSLPIAA